MEFLHVLWLLALAIEPQWIITALIIWVILDFLAIIGQDLVDW